LRDAEKAPRRLDAAYKEALNLEMWQKNVAKRVPSQRTPSQERANAFKNEMDDRRKRKTELDQYRNNKGS